MTVQVVLVHGIRTSATMWRHQLAFLAEQGCPADAVDLPGHGVRRGEPWSLDEAVRAIDTAVQRAARRGPVLLVAHSMGALVSTHYLGGDVRPPVAGFVSAGATALPRRVGIGLYRSILWGLRHLPGQGVGVARAVLWATHPPETRGDYAAGGYALDVEDAAVASLGKLDLERDLSRIRIPTWFVNGSRDQLRVDERTFIRRVPQSQLFVVPRTTHLVTTMRPDTFNAILSLAIRTIRMESGGDGAVVSE